MYVSALEWTYLFQNISDYSDESWNRFIFQIINTNIFEKNGLIFSGNMLIPFKTDTTFIPNMKLEPTGD